MSKDLPRLSASERNVLEQLIGKDKYGLELVADSGDMLSRRSVYVILGRMEEKGFITGREVETPAGESGPPRRVYRVTGHGRRVLAAHEAALAILRGAR
jgi:DNA-binding PadR family transcriptional regulator